MTTAIITGGSRGFGRALTAQLVRDGWTVIIDGRDIDAVLATAAQIDPNVIPVPGDITDAVHRNNLLAAAERAGGLDLLVNNASTLGPSPMPTLADFPVSEIGEVFRTNTGAPLALIQVALPQLRTSHGAIVNITSDAAREPYEGWGMYGASKAALEQLSRILAAEEPDVRVWSFDPGDMRTQMHQDAFPGEDISDRPLPEAVAVPAFVGLLAERPASGLIKAGALVEVAVMARLSFALPPALEASSPPEARRLSRDGVRMMVAHRDTGELVHTKFRALPDFLRPGDLVVVNTSGVLAAALSGLTADGKRVGVHLSTKLTTDRWVVEFREGDDRWDEDTPTHVALGEGASLDVIGPHRDSDRLFVARLTLPMSDMDWIGANGRPIRYSYVDKPWPIAMYQNVYATEAGSAEMPSAGRPFTPQLITRLVAKGIAVAPLVLHTGVASLEADELPYPEYARVPAITAAMVNLTHEMGGRVIAVGTTVVRALESAGDTYGHVEAYDGWTDLVITPERGVRFVDGLITGWHEPEASHLLMLEAIAGRELLEKSYEASLAEGYLWHEFGDTHLIVP